LVEGVCVLFGGVCCVRGGGEKVGGLGCKKVGSFTELCGGFCGCGVWVSCTWCFGVGCCCLFGLLLCVVVGGWCVGFFGWGGGVGWVGGLCFFGMVWVGEIRVLGLWGALHGGVCGLFGVLLFFFLFLVCGFLVGGVVYGRWPSVV